VPILQCANPCRVGDVAGFAPKLDHKCGQRTSAKKTYHVKLLVIHINALQKKICLAENGSGINACKQYSTQYLEHPSRSIDIPWAALAVTN
jgi:hypothetical protein